MEGENKMRTRVMMVVFIAFLLLTLGSVGYLSFRTRLRPAVVEKAAQKELITMIDSIQQGVAASREILNSPDIEFRRLQPPPPNPDRGGVIRPMIMTPAATERIRITNRVVNTERKIDQLKARVERINEKPAQEESDPLPRITEIIGILGSITTIFFSWRTDRRDVVRLQTELAELKARG
jgi:hypothetical protein